MQIGSRVVCVDASIKPHMADEIAKDFQQWVVKDQQYIIRDIFYNDGIVTSVVLEEIRNIPLFFKNTIGRVQEPSFKIDRFRELEPPKKVVKKVEESLVV